MSKINWKGVYLSVRKKSQSRGRDNAGEINRLIKEHRDYKDINREEMLKKEKRRRQVAVMSEGNKNSLMGQ